MHLEAIDQTFRPIAQTLRANFKLLGLKLFIAAGGNAPNRRSKPPIASGGKLPNSFGENSPTGQQEASSADPAEPPNASGGN